MTVRPEPMPPGPPHSSGSLLPAPRLHRITTLQRRLGRAVRRLRLARKFSQEGFADRIGVHRTYMGAVERGEQNISLMNLDRVAKGLGLKAWELLKEADQETG